MLRSLFLMFVVMAVMPMIVIYPHIGVLVWTWFSTMNPHRLAFGFMLDFPVLQVLGGLTIVAWLFSPERKVPPNHPIIWAMAIFFLWTCVSTLFSVDFSPKYDKLDTYWKIILFAMLTACMINTRKRIEFLIMVSVIGIGYYAIRGAFGTIISGGQYSYSGPPGTFIDDRNSLSLCFVMIIPMLVYLGTYLKQKHLRILALISIPICIIAVLGTQSRGGFISLAAMGVWLILGTKRRFVGLAAMVITGALAVGFMPETWSNRMETVQSFEDDSSMQGRLQMWRYAVDLSADHPFVGGGFRAFANRRLAGSYLPAGISLRASHSVYYEALGEHGMPGLFFYLVILASFFFTCSAIKKLTKSVPDLKWAYDLGAMLQASLIGFSVGAGLLEIIVFDIFYTFAVMAAILHVLVIQTIKQGIESAAPTEGFPTEWLLDSAPARQAGS